MKNLNRTSFDVWSEYLKNDNNQNITDRILILDTYDKLTPEEEAELNILLNLEKKFISESEQVVAENKKYLKSFNYYKNLLEKDERLLTIFYERVSQNIYETDQCNVEDLKNIYISMMEEDMDVDGHDKLVQFYQEIIKDEETVSEPCGDPTCIYCSPITKDEFMDAIDDLNSQGYLDKETPEQERLVKLMVTIHRLQDELAMYKPDDEDCDDEDFEE